MQSTFTQKNWQHSAVERKNKFCVNGPYNNRTIYTGLKTKDFIFGIFWYFYSPHHKKERLLLFYNTFGARKKYKLINVQVLFTKKIKANELFS